ncbi:MAG TPA: hypothetical protein VIF15_01970 [Polyangiaceae bacterium]|jgi:hypothetical protein
MPAKRADVLTDALDRLYAAPLERFVALRKELAGELRASGDVAAATEMAAAPKPTRTAWALGQVARQHPERLRAMLEARDAGAALQKHGDAEQLRASHRAYRARVAEVLAAAREVLAADGGEASADQLRRMGETLQAASAPGSDARALLVAGRLARDVGVEDPFAGMEPGPARPRREAAPAPPTDRTRAEAARAQRAHEQQQAKEAAAAEAARQRIMELEASLRDKRTAARRAELAALRAQAEAERARRAADEAEAHVKRAREALRETKR